MLSFQRKTLGMGAEAVCLDSLVALTEPPSHRMNVRTIRRAEATQHAMPTDWVLCLLVDACGLRIRTLDFSPRWAGQQAALQQLEAFCLSLI